MIGSIDGLTGKMHFIHFVMSVYKSMFNRSMKASIGFLLHLNFEGGEGYHPLIYEGLYENLVELQERRDLLFP